MRYLGVWVCGLLSLVSLDLGAKEVCDTLTAPNYGRIIIRYNLEANDSQVTLTVSGPPRIIPSEALRQTCKGDVSRLKLVVFDRVGAYGATKWAGDTPRAFMVPAGLRYTESQEGFYILGQSQAVAFSRLTPDEIRLDLPLFVALYEKKQTYRIVDGGKISWHISVPKVAEKRRGEEPATDPERIAIQTRVELDSDNADVVNALNSISLIRQLLANETQAPLSQTLNMELANLRLLKGRITDPEVLDKISQVIVECSEKERQLLNEQKAAQQAETAKQEDKIQQQKQEEEARRLAEEEKERIKEEKRQKRTIWMVIGGALLAVICMIGNGIFKHFHDLNSQKSVMEMQMKLTQQAESEAKRRTREIVRNKTHQAVNKGRSEIKQRMQGNGAKRGEAKNDKKRKEI